MIKAGIIGSTGYAGVELLRLLLKHPKVKISGVSSQSFEGQHIDEVYANLLNIANLPLTSADSVIKKSDVVFACLPHGLSEEIAKTCFEKNTLFIDLGADFRLHNEEDYNTWYGIKYQEKDLHKNSVYGLCEVFRDEIKNAKIIGNPGCYPTSIALGLYPALKNKLIDIKGIIIDSKSGVTGAGRGLSLNTHYPECNEAFSPYKIASHRHTPEIEQSLSSFAGEQINITFVPHLLPVNRGIISTMYCKTTKDFDEIYSVYENAYKNEPFVRLLKKSDIANLKNVKFSNYCNISLHLDSRTNTLIIVSAIDNMVKGAAGQAIQNMNIVYGFDEKTGLDYIPPAF